MKTNLQHTPGCDFSSFCAAAATSSRYIALLAVLGAALSAPALAQTTDKPGSTAGVAAAPQPGMGPGMGGVSPGMSGRGPGPRKAMRFSFNKDNTPGWALMSAEERTVHRDKLRGARTYDECKALQDEHHKAMEGRAKEKGVTLPTPRQNGCDRMKARGFFK